MGSRNSNSVNQKKRRGRKRKKALIIFAVIAAVAGMLFGVTYKVFEADTIEFVGSTHYSDEELKKYDVILQDKIRTEMLKRIIVYYSDNMQASKDNKTFLTRYINSLRA